MSTSVADKDRPTFNPEMLHWARRRAGVSVAKAAKTVGVNESRVEQWEALGGKDAPTVRQARALANLYKRSFLEFFRAQPPDLPLPQEIPDFRLYAQADDPSSTKELREIQLWAEVQRDNALDLFSEIAETPPAIPEALFTTINASEEASAQRARELIKFPIQEQVGRNAEGRRKIASELRRKIEALGILTFRRTDLKHLRVRGLCIAVFPLPIIVIGKEAVTAEAFTLAHEFAHVAIRQSAISGSIPRTGGDYAKRNIEEWCNRFAGAFLMPKSAVQAYFGSLPKNLDQISDDVLHAVALHFGVSDHAMIVRLVQLECVQPSYYWNVKKPLFDEEEKNFKEHGGPPLYYGTRYRNRQGDLYTGLVMEAWDTGRITGHHAAEYMGIKNIQHVYDIRDHFPGG